MKTLFFPTSMNFRLNKEKIKNFPIKEHIFIAYSIQYKEVAEEIKNILNQRVNGFSQILGCSKPKIPKNTNAIILVSSGRFHALSLAYETSKEVYLFEDNNFIKIKNEEIEEFKKKKKAKYSNFLNSKNIGIIVSTKPGQQNLEKSLDLKKKLEKKFSDKSIYLFLTNNIDFNNFENFDIQFWINSACPRLDFDDFNNKTMNISDIAELLNSF